MLCTTLPSLPLPFLFFGLLPSSPSSSLSLESAFLCTRGGVGARWPVALASCAMFTSYASGPPNLISSRIVCKRGGGGGGGEGEGERCFTAFVDFGLAVVDAVDVDVESGLSVARTVDGTSEDAAAKSGLGGDGCLTSTSIFASKLEIFSTGFSKFSSLSIEILFVVIWEGLCGERVEFEPGTSTSSSTMMGIGDAVMSRDLF